MSSGRAERNAVVSLFFVLMPKRNPASEGLGLGLNTNKWRFILVSFRLGYICSLSSPPSLPQAWPHCSLYYAAWHIFRMCMANDANIKICLDNTQSDIRHSSVICNISGETRVGFFCWPPLYQQKGTSPSNNVMELIEHIGLPCGLTFFFCLFFSLWKHCELSHSSTIRPLKEKKTECIFLRVTKLMVLHVFGKIRHWLL